MSPFRRPGYGKVRVYIRKLSADRAALFATRVLLENGSRHRVHLVKSCMRIRYGRRTRQTVGKKVDGLLGRSTGSISTVKSTEHDSEKKRRTVEDSRRTRPFGRNSGRKKTRQIRMKVGELVGKSTDSSHSNEDRPAGKKVGSVRQGRFRENSADSERKKLDKFGELVGKLTDSSDSKETQRTRKKVGSFRCS